MGKIRTEIKEKEEGKPVKEKEILSKVPVQRKAGLQLIDMMGETYGWSPEQKAMLKKKYQRILNGIKRIAMSRWDKGYSNITDDFETGKNFVNGIEYGIGCLYQTEPTGKALTIMDVLYSEYLDDDMNCVILHDILLDFGIKTNFIVRQGRTYLGIVVAGNEYTIDPIPEECACRWMGEALISAKGGYGGTGGVYGDAGMIGLKSGMLNGIFGGMEYKSSANELRKEQEKWQSEYNEMHAEYEKKTERFNKLSADYGTAQGLEKKIKESKERMGNLGSKLERAKGRYKKEEERKLEKDYKEKEKEYKNARRKYINARNNYNELKNSPKIMEQEVLVNPEWLKKAEEIYKRAKKNYHNALNEYEAAKKRWEQYLDAKKTSEDIADQYQVAKLEYEKSINKLEDIYTEITGQEPKSSKTEELMEGINQGYQKAKDAYEHEKSEFDNAEEWYLNRIKSYDEKIQELDKKAEEKFRIAAKFSEKVEEIAPKIDWIQTYKGIAKFHLGDLEGARKDIDKSIQMNPEGNFFGYMWKGILESSAGNYNNAINSFDKSREIAVDAGAHEWFFQVLENYKRNTIKKMTETKR